MAVYASEMLEFEQIVGYLDATALPVTAPPSRYRDVPLHAGDELFPAIEYHRFILEVDLERAVPVVRRPDIETMDDNLLLQEARTRPVDIVETVRIVPATRNLRPFVDTDRQGAK